MARKRFDATSPVDPLKKFKEELRRSKQDAKDRADWERQQQRKLRDKRLQRERIRERFQKQMRTT